MLSWIIDGVEYSLDDGSLCYCTGMDGLGMMPVSRIEESGPLQNGSTDRGYRLNSRIISLALVINADTQADLWQKRSELTSIFKPGNRHGILKWKLGNLVRQIDGHFVDGLTFTSKDRSGWTQKTGVMIKCNDPVWYDPAGKAATLVVDVGSGGSGVIPMVVPSDIGASGINSIIALDYNGTVDSYPQLIRITGPITSCVITNLVTNDKLDFSGDSIAAGDYYDIDLRYGYKTVKDKNGTSKLDKLSTDSDLTTFRILSHPDAPGGVNSIRINGSGETSATRIDIGYQDRFLGI